MSLDQPIAWSAGHPVAVVLAAGVLLALLAGTAAFIVHRTSGAVLTAGIGALVCTAYTADTSWGFAEHRLGMTEADERLTMFAAGEIALLACAVMARANKKATAIDGGAGTPGVPGVLVWCITGIQIIPAYSESGFWGGTVRAVIGPVMAGLLWHLAMGLEIRVARPEALSTGLPAQIGHELRERLLSYLGLATRGRTAAQVSRDRATARTVRLASRKRLGWWGRAALKASVARSGAATNGTQRHQLMQLLAARRGAAELRTVPVTSPWLPHPVPEPYPGTPLGVTGAELRRMDPLDAVLQIHAAHPTATPAELSSLSTEYGVPVSETQVRIALRASGPSPVPAVPALPERPQLDAAPIEESEPVPAVPHAVEYTYQAGGLHLDLTTEPQVRREFASAVPAAMVRTRPTRTEVHARVPDPPLSLEHPADFIRRRATEEREARPEPARTRPEVHPVPVPDPTPLPEVEDNPEETGTAGTDAPDGWERLLARAREVDAEHQHKHRRPASIQTLKTELGVGQPKAQRIRNELSGRA